MPENFADRLMSAIRRKRTPLCVGIDPVYGRLPAEIAEHRDLNDENDAEAALDAILEFSRRVIRIVAPLVPAVKINSAFFERYYGEGVEGYYDLVQEAASLDLVVIGDVKRADVGHSAEMYARSCLSDPDFDNLDDQVSPDAVTVNPYLGLDAVKPFIQVAREEQKGVFVLVRTSNESAAEIQHVRTDEGATLADHVAGLVHRWAVDDGLVGQGGLSCVGAVVSTRDADEARRLRALLDSCVILVPGYGAQGLSAEEAAPLFKSDGSGAIINASRSILYAYDDVKYMEMYASEWQKCVERACQDAIADIAKVIRLT